MRSARTSPRCGWRTSTIWDVTVQPTDASKDNIVFIQDGELDLAMVQNDAMAYAYEGNEFYGNEIFDGFYAIGTLYPEAVQCVVAADSDIHTIADLAGRTSPSARRAPAPT